MPRREDAQGKKIDSHKPVIEGSDGEGQNAERNQAVKLKLAVADDIIGRYHATLKTLKG